MVYYLELCNCDVLTAFCLFKEDEKKANRKPGQVPKYMKLMDAVLGTYNESGQVRPSAFGLPQLFKTGIMVHRWVKKAREELLKTFDERVETALSGVEEADEADPQLMERFMGRQKTYCDVCQGFSQEDLASALCKSGNHAPTALLLLAACRKDVKVFFPPQYLLSEGGRVQQQVMAVSAPTQKRFGSFSMFASKPFADVEKGNQARSSTRSTARSSTRSTTSMRSSVGRFLSWMEHPKLKERRPRESGKMLELTFENNPKMQEYLAKSFTHARRQVQVPDMEGLEEVYL